MTSHWLPGLALVLASTMARADILVAVPVPASGPQSALGQEIAAGVSAAVAEINARGGVLGETLAVRTSDDGCNGAPAATAAARIAGDKPALIVGHPCAGGAVAGAKVYGPAKLLFIATETRHAALTDKRAGPTIFRLSGRDDAQGAFAGQYLAQRFPAKRVAVVSDRTAYARSIVDRARVAMIAAGNPDVAMLTIVAGEKDYSALIARVRDWQCAAVLFAGFPVEAASIVRQMRAAGITVPFIGTDAVATEEFAAAAGDVAEGVQVLVPSASAPDPTPPTATASAEAASVPRQLGAGLRARAAVEIWAAAAREASSAAPEAVASALAKAPHASALGPIAFDAKGDANIASYTVLTRRGDTWVAKPRDALSPSPEKGTAAAP